ARRERAEALPRLGARDPQARLADRVAFARGERAEAARGAAEQALVPGREPARGEAREPVDVAAVGDPGEVDPQRARRRARATGRAQGLELSQADRLRRPVEAEADRLVAREELLRGGPRILALALELEHDLG